ncbi:FecR family protein [Pseudomonas fakonensis]|uniref:FecR family protein n=1 Tax=Pseudomonas fakonensis TaxID=2842355 RepID=UPI001CECBF7E|nr:FecR domain-containing protein [Pseudomonas fakonensis]
MAGIEEQAAEWVLRLGEGALDAGEQAELDDWLLADPRHQATLQRMQGVIHQLQGLREQRGPVSAALAAGNLPARRTPAARRTLLGLALAAALLGGLQLGGVQPQVWLADARTAPAEWRSLALEDGSQVTLAGNSAVDLQFTAGERRLRLLRGQVLVDVAHDPARPFVVQTDEGSFRALGTRFVVSEGAGRSELTMLESRVEARSAEAGGYIVAGRGERAWVERERVGPLPAIDPQRIDLAWQQHQLVADGLPLDQVLDALAAQRRGLLRFDRAALHGIKVSAVLPLDDSERALQLLAEALPVQVRRFGPWWTSVERVPAKN